MGSGVTFLEGFKKAGLLNAVGVIGDSTFVHSGITGLINMSYNKAKGLLIIVDNGTTAMTGNQPHPATGKTVKGEDTRKLILEDICKAAGAENVDVINPNRIREFESLVRKRMAEDKLSVIISRYPCRLIEKSREAAPVYTKELCKKCGVCLSTNCPSLEKTADDYITINQDICAGCNLCVEACYFGALKKHGG